MGIVDVTGYESIVVGDTAVGLTSSLILPANGHKQTKAWITIEGSPIRFRTDGTNPTANEGHLVDTGESFEVEGFRNLQRFRAIRITTYACTLRVSVGR